MALLIVIEIVLSVVFASVMMFYMGMHFINSRQEEKAEEAVSDSENSEEAAAASSEKKITENKKLHTGLNKESLVAAFEAIKSKKLLWLFFVMLLFSLGTWFYDMLYLELAMMKCYINSVVFSLIITMGYIDFKEHIIPNPLILTGMGIWGIGFIVEIFAGGTPFREVLTFSLLGFAVCGGILLVLAVIMKSGLGMGDVKMFAMLGLLYGLANTYSLLICTVIPMAVFALILLAKKKATRKSALPMAPFTVLAFLLGIISGM